MPDHQVEKPNEESIKPVSSLRSHFETIGSGVSTPQSPSQPSLLHPGLHGYTEFAKDRSSLDLPRQRTPQSNTARDGQAGNLNNVPSFYGGKQRPSSAGSNRPLSPPKSAFVPPQVTIQSPITPGQQNVARNARPLRQTAPYSSPTPGASPATGISSDFSFPIRHINIQAVHRDVVKPKERNGPPPINRADKPKLATSNIATLRKSSLQADTVPVDDRASPFSTPPSSDGSPHPQNQSGIEKFSIQAAPSNSPRARDSYFPPPPKRVSTVSQEPKGLQQITKQSLSRDSHLTSNQAAMSDQPNARPNLPTRNRVDESNRPLIRPGPENSLIRIDGNTDSSDHRQGKQHPGSQPRNSASTQPGFLPPPRRTATFSQPQPPQAARPDIQLGTKPHRDQAGLADAVNFLTATAANSREYPDASNVNRRPPTAKDGARRIEIGYDTKLSDLWRGTVCTSGHMTRAWDVNTGDLIASTHNGEGSNRMTAMAFKPAASFDEEGQVVWLGNTYGEIFEVDLKRRGAWLAESRAHGGREVVKIHRHQSSMWTLDEDGKLYIWSANESGVPDLRSSPASYRLARGHTFSITIKERLWLACGRDIRVYQPEEEVEQICLTPNPLGQTGAGEVTSGATIYGQYDRVYFGHADGKVTYYSTSDFVHLGTVTISVYKINALAGVGRYLWAGFNSGMIYAYDTSTQPWVVKKDWLAHKEPVANIIVDRSSLWSTGVLRTASIGTDNAIRMWEGTLEDDFLEEDMQSHDSEFCTFQELKALVVTWNAGASTPGDLRYEDKDNNFFRILLQEAASSDILVFGFQELVDLEDKKLTAMSIFKGNRKKDPTEHEHMSRQYRAWRDHLVRCIEDTMPSNETYTLLHTANMVGLFSCIFIKSSLRHRVSRVSNGEVKRGMGGLHGNKGALIYRLVLDDTSLCFINCHLAAGQTQTMGRNNDVSAILDSMALAPEYSALQDGEVFTGGGDGSMILDHEICILNGDLNYRIDTMSRDIVIKAVQAGNFGKLLDRDQLLVSRRRNPGFRLHAFMESPISFAPTYKYDVGTDRYDTSEKHRAPAWCDRILYRGVGKVKQLSYQRHEMRTSDHRPVSATFKMRIKHIIPEDRARVWKECQSRLKAVKQQLSYDAKIGYLRDVLGMDVDEARKHVVSFRNP